MLDFAPGVRSTEVGRLVLDFNWASTPLGPMHVWPQSLKSVVSIMLSNPSQSCVAVHLFTPFTHAKFIGS